LHDRVEFLEMDLLCESLMPDEYWDTGGMTTGRGKPNSQKKKLLWHLFHHKFCTNCLRNGPRPLWCYTALRNKITAKLPS
jgi:hypothetical protein